MRPIHTVHFEVCKDEITPIFHCYAHKGDAFCRMNCTMNCPTIQECEPDHEATDYGTCMFVEWMEDDGGMHYYGGEKTRARAGMIIPEWAGDYWVWRYPKPGEIYR